jgi:chlorobactene glucosyltransferase
MSRAMRIGQFSTIFDRPMWFDPWFIAYLLLGPVAWLGLIVLALFARRRMGKLHRSRAILPTPAPSLTIVVPARNEGADIEECVRRTLRQDYPNLAVVAINDRSSDDTAAVLERLVVESVGRMKAVHVVDLPDGWLGKCHALHVGTRPIDSEWVLFVDSDVKLEPDAARRTVAMCVDREYDVLSIFPRLDAPTFWETTLLPLLAVVWNAAYATSLTNDDSKPDHAFANGQFLLCRRSTYEQIGNHESVKDQIVEDVAIMRKFKRSGARVRLMLGQQLAQTRMHTNLRQMFNGWARIFAGSSYRRVGRLALATAFLATTAAALLWAILTGGWAWQLAAATHAALWLGLLTWTYRSTGQSAWNVLAAPVALPMVLAILLNAIRVCLTGRVDWRGNQVRVNSK